MPVKKDGVTTYQTQDRRYVAKEQLLNEMFESIGGLRRIIESSPKADPYGDARLDALVMYIMTYTLDYDSYSELMEERNKRIDDVLERHEAVDIHNKKIFRINIDMIAKCMETFDNYIGFKKKQIVMEVADCETSKRLNELSYTLFDKAFATGEPCCTDEPDTGDS